MKRIVKIISIVAFIGLFVFFGFEVVYEIKYKKQVAENIKNIPRFSYMDIRGEKFDNNSLNKEQPIIFIYFNSECEFCNVEAAMIKSNIKKLANKQLIFISYESIDSIKKFAQVHQLDNLNNITFIHDEKMSFQTKFDAKSLPSIIIYDKNKRLVEKINGQILIENLLQKLEGNK